MTENTPTNITSSDITETSGPSEQEIRSRIEGMLDLDDAPRKRKAASPPQPPPEDTPESGEEPDIEEDGSPPIDDYDVDQDEPLDDPQDDHTAIDSAPASWTAEEKRLWADLSPEVKNVISRREGQRDKALNQRLQEVSTQRSEAQRAIQAEQTARIRAQQAYADTLNQIINLNLPEVQELENTDWVALSQTDPNEFVRKQAQERALKQRVALMQQEIANVTQEQQQRILQTHQHHIAQQHQKLVEQDPTFRDPTTAKAAVTAIVNTLHQHGFNDTEIAGIADSRIISLLSKLSRYEQREAARQRANGKMVPAQPQRMLPPNSTTRSDSGNKRIKDLQTRFHKSGRVEDAAKLIETMI